MVEKPVCNLEHVWYFHTECPDYIKKYDNPETGKKYLKQQLYNMLSLPYYNFRKNLASIPSSEESMPSLKKNTAYVEYPELRRNLLSTSSVNLLLDKELRSSFSEGAEFKADPETSESD